MQKQKIFIFRTVLAVETEMIKQSNFDDVIDDFDQKQEKTSNNLIEDAILSQAYDCRPSQTNLFNVSFYFQNQFKHLLLIEFIPFSKLNQLYCPYIIIYICNRLFTPFQRRSYTPNICMREIPFSVVTQRPSVLYQSYTILVRCRHFSDSFSFQNFNRHSPPPTVHVRHNALHLSYLHSS